MQPVIQAKLPFCQGYNIQAKYLYMGVSNVYYTKVRIRKYENEMFFLLYVNMLLKIPK